MVYAGRTGGNACSNDQRRNTNHRGADRGHTHRRPFSNPQGGQENQSILTIYPEEYRSWLEVKDRSGIISKDNGIQKIVYPADNSVFFIDPAVPSADQILRIESTGFSRGNSSVFINGVKIGETDNGSYYFELQKGEWEIEFKATGDADRIKITVK